MTSPGPSAVTGAASMARNRLVLVVYTAAIFVSALLLFSVQPLFTKMVLPRLGGSPAVWSVAMVFFQSLLLGGYAYAHYLMQLRNRMLPVAIHLVLLVIALLTLPLSIAGGWGEPPTSGYAFWLLGLFAVSIGLPFFALAANNPLLQAWFVRTGHPNGPDPYFLYASSNIGSFLALLSYPVLLEPMFALRTQNLIWTGGYGLLIVLIAACGVLLLRSPVMAERDLPAEEARRSGAVLGLARALDIPRRGAVGPADRGDRAHLHRRRRRTSAVGAAAVAVFADLGAGVPVAPAAAAQMDAAAAAAGDSGRGRAAGGRRRTQPADHARRPPAVLLCHRDGLSRRTGPDPAGDDLSHRLLRGAVVRRHGRRTVRGADRALHVLVDRGISDPCGPGGAVPSADGGAVAALEPLVLAAARRRRGAADRAVVQRRQAVCLAGGSAGLCDQRGRGGRNDPGLAADRRQGQVRRHCRAGAGADPRLSGATTDASKPCAASSASTRSW